MLRLGQLGHPCCSGCICMPYLLSNCVVGNTSFDGIKTGAENSMGRCSVTLDMRTKS